MILPLLFAVVYPAIFTGTDTAKYTKVPPPGVQFRRNMAMATSAPWVDSNLWKYRREQKMQYLCDVRQKSVVLAAVEAFMENVNVSLQTAPEQRKDYDEILAFLKQIPEGPTRPWANYAVSDDGSAQAGEVMNLLARRNMLYEVKPGSPIALTAKMTNPYDAMQDIREKFGDEKRNLRLFGSELTLAELSRDGKKVRLQLINYGTRPVEYLRVRLLGKVQQSSLKAYIFRSPNPVFKDWTFEGGATEFTLESLPVFGVLDLNLE